MPFFLRTRTSKSRKLHLVENCICLCRFCCALRRTRTTSDSLTRVSVSVLKRYNFCLWSFKYKLFYGPSWNRVILFSLLYLIRDKGTIESQLVVCRGITEISCLHWGGVCALNVIEISRAETAASLNSFAKKKIQLYILAGCGEEKKRRCVITWFEFGKRINDFYWSILETGVFIFKYFIMMYVIIVILFSLLLKRER